MIRKGNSLKPPVYRLADKGAGAEAAVGGAGMGMQIYHSNRILSYYSKQENDPNISLYKMANIAENSTKKGTINT
jgi:hypothetical protein